MSIADQNAARLLAVQLDCKTFLMPCYKYNQLLISEQRFWSVYGN